MSDATPQPMPDYNTPAQPKFSLARMLTESDGSYSAFWPLVIVFFGFIVLLVYEVSYLRYRKLVVTEQLGQYPVLEKRAKEQSDFIKGFRRDLEALEPTHPDVAAIMKFYFPDASPGPNAPQK